MNGGTVHPVTADDNTHLPTDAHRVLLPRHKGPRRQPSHSQLARKHPHQRWHEPTPAALWSLLVPDPTSTVLQISLWVRRVLVARMLYHHPALSPEVPGRCWVGEGGVAGWQPRA